VSGFSLLNIANMCSLVMLIDLGLCLVINSYTHWIWMDICISRIGIFLEICQCLLCRCWSFFRCVSNADSQVGQAYVIMNLIRALRRVSLLLVLNRSLLNKEYNVINVM
jgi:hypothetical protein